jgi:hypothetical protein
MSSSVPWCTYILRFRFHSHGYQWYWSGLVSPSPQSCARQPLWLCSFVFVLVLLSNGDGLSTGGGATGSSKHWLHSHRITCSSHVLGKQEDTWQQTLLSLMDKQDGQKQTETRKKSLSKLYGYQGHLFLTTHLLFLKLLLSSIECYNSHVNYI